MKKATETKTIESDIQVFHVIAHPMFDLVEVDGYLKMELKPIIDRFGPEPKNDEDRFAQHLIAVIPKAMQTAMNQGPQRVSITLFYTSKQYEDLGKPTIGDSLTVQVQKRSHERGDEK